MILERRSIFDLDWREVNCESPSGQARALSEARTSGATSYIIRTTASGQTFIQYTALILDEDHTHEYARRFLRKCTHSWDAGYITLIDRPVLVDLRFGTFFIKNEGKATLLNETLYGFSSNEQENYISTIEQSEEFRDLFFNIPASIQDNKNIMVSLLNNKSDVYFHMMSECLLQAYIFAKYQIDENIVFISPAQYKNVTQILSDQAHLFGLKILRSSDRYAWLPRAAFYSCFQQHARLNPDFRDMIQYLKFSHDKSPIINNIGIWNKSPNASDRFYISRTQAKARPLENESELIALAESYGFRVIDPGTLSFAEQVTVFGRASHIIGPHGAGLTNAAFAPSGATLIEFRGLNRASQSPSRNETYRRLSACMGLQYGCLMFENDVGSERWSIDLATINRLLERIDRPAELPRIPQTSLPA